MLWSCPSFGVLSREGMPTSPALHQLYADPAAAAAQAVDKIAAARAELSAAH